MISASGATVMFNEELKHHDAKIPATVYTAIIGIAGTLIGLFIGHFLTAAREHQKWLADQKKAEYRELIDLLYDTITVVLQQRPGLPRPTDPTILDAGVKKLARMFEDRIFIAKRLRESGAYDQWLDIKRMIHYEAELHDVTDKKLHYSAIGLQLNEDSLRMKLVELANEDMVRFKLRW